jgi:hypothetical protein
MRRTPGHATMNYGDDEEGDRLVATDAILGNKRRREMSRPSLNSHGRREVRHSAPKPDGARDREDGWRAPFPHEEEEVKSPADTVSDWVMGVPAKPYPQFTIKGVDTGVANLSMFAHHESALDDVMTPGYLITLCMLGLVVVFGFLATLVVCGIVDSYSNGAIFLVIAIMVALLVIMRFGALLMDWPRRSPYSHQHTNALFFPVMYFAIAFLFALIALGYWVTKYQSSFFATYDAAAAPAAERPFYYAVYTLLACVCVSILPEMLTSLIVQHYPERKVYLHSSDGHNVLYYNTDDPTLGMEVLLNGK